MPQQSIEVFCEYEADDGIRPLGIMNWSHGFEKEQRKGIPGFRAEIAVQANR
jgi:hypothetical protein